MATSSPTSTNPTHGEDDTKSEKKESPALPESSGTKDAGETPVGSEEGAAGAEEPLIELLDNEQLEERLGEARKAVIVGKFEDAIHLLPSCLATITDKDGDLCLRLAEPHCLYGKSLFECARSGAGVFGEGVLKEASKEGEGGEEGEEGDSSQEDEVCAESTEEVNETEPSNFELAWENLEVCRVICSKHLETSRDVPLAKILLEALTCLGELQVETGCYEKATDDFLQCIQLLDKFPEICTKKLLGATHYSIGISCSLAGEHQQAVKGLEAALETLNELINETEENSEEASSLKELVEDIKPRLAEAQELMREKSEESLVAAKPAPSDQPTSSNGAESCQPPGASRETRSKELGAVKVNDISHLVRKKRPAEGGASEPDDGKRSKTDPSGDSCSGES